ncbi:MAG: hypothetical protein IT537_23080 [Hyphomicrobiales bacterium]|nr:hypothetical protein [Hyphomicrobiales bacterium]
MSKPLPIALTFDLDPDVFDESIESTDRRSKLTWRCITDGIPRICASLDAFRDGSDARPRATWFVRVDNQIADIYGRPAHLLQEFAPGFERIGAMRHEIGWHPHLYRAVNGGWEQETDEVALDSSMEAALRDMQSLGHRPRCARIGEAYGSVGIMRTLDRLGLGFDATAMAGRRRVDGERTIDWAPTPCDGYHPSCSDHRVPGSPHFSVIEIPMSMLKVQAAYDSEPLVRYLDLSFHPGCLGRELSQLVARAPYLMTVTHPSALLPECRPPKPHGLLAYDLSALTTNLTAILAAARACGRTPQFVTVAQLGDIIAKRLDG